MQVWDIYTKQLIDRLYGNVLPYNYQLLCFLNNISYRWCEDFPMDENRAFDGLSLREDYFLYEDRDCTILEMLMALAIRIDREYVGDPYDPRPDIFFNNMIKNMNFNFLIFDEEAKEIVFNRFNDWIQKRSNPNGYNTPFPIKNPVVPQNELQIWDQAQAYIYEKMRR